VDLLYDFDVKIKDIALFDDYVYLDLICKSADALEIVAFQFDPTIGGGV
jgi:hypothetical protein